MQLVEVGAVEKPVQTRLIARTRAAVPPTVPRAGAVPERALQQTSGGFFSPGGCMAVATIATVVNSIKAATDIGKYLVEAKGAIDRVDLTVKLLELVDALAAAKFKALEADDELRAKDARIAELEKAMAEKAAVVKKHDAYYRVDAEGKPTGAPFCLRCWEVDNRLLHLTMAKGFGVVICNHCKAEYDSTAAGHY